MEKLEKTIEIIEKQDKNNKSIGYYPNNNLEKTIKILNIKNIKIEFKKIKTKKPINEIYLFSMSGNYIESSGPKIFDKNHNLIISFDDIGFCDHICIITENLLVISQKNILILLRIINAKQNEYKFKKFNNTLKNESIKKIIRGLKENEIITSDVKGNIGFWSIILKDDDFILEMTNFIETYYDSNTYILLFKNILIVGADKLYLYNIEDSNHKDTKFKNKSSFNIKPLCWNSMIIINENKNLNGIGCEGCAFILQVNSIDSIKIIKEIKIPRTCDCLCLYLNTFLILGSRNGNIYFYDYNNNYELIKTIEAAHQLNKDSNASINGIIELSDGSFASFGEDKEIKIWSI